MSPHLDELKARLLEVNDLGSAAAVLRWDQATYMPPGGAEARGRQTATLAGSPTRSSPTSRSGGCSTSSNARPPACPTTRTRSRWCA